MKLLQRILYHPFFIRLLNWEYWSMSVVYAPVYPFFAWLIIRTGGRYFISATNPSIPYGGFLMESKKKVYDLLPHGLYPVTLFFKAGTTASVVIEKIKEKGLEFPVLVKPDIGMRGLAVRKLDTVEDIMDFIPLYTVDFLIQEFISYHKEAGIFYYRFPGADKGKISGIVAKELLTVTGDGHSTLQQLIKKDKRHVLQSSFLEKEYSDEINVVVPAGEQRVLVPYGNHARGARFLDHSQLTDAALEKVIDDLCKTIPGFYFGRLDIRFHDWNDLRQGKNFSVIELNGAGSEPAHIYDPRHRISYAWKEIIRHACIAFRIGRINKQNGAAYLSWAEGAKMFADNKNHIRQLKKIQEAIINT